MRNSDIYRLKWFTLFIISFLILIGMVLLAALSVTKVEQEKEHNAKVMYATYTYIPLIENQSEKHIISAIEDVFEEHKNVEVKEQKEENLTENIQIIENITPLAEKPGLVELSDDKVNKQLEEKTYYDELTEYEISLLEVVVQHEVGGLGEEYKRLIAELLYNRLKSGYFPSDIKEMLYQEGQFQGIEYWYSPDFEVDEITKKVVKEVFSKEETRHNAIAYYNPALSSPNGIEWFETSPYINFIFDYTETSWGVEYTTKFYELNLDGEI